MDTNKCGQPNTVPNKIHKLDEKVKTAMYTVQQTEGQRLQVTPLSYMSLGNYGKPDPIQAWTVTCHNELVDEDCVNAGELYDMLSHHKPLTGFNYAVARLKP